MLSAPKGAEITPSSAAIFAFLLYRFPGNTWADEHNTSLPDLVIFVCDDQLSHLTLGFSNSKKFAGL